MPTAPGRLFQRYRYNRNKGLDDFELLPDLAERAHGAVEVGVLVRGRDLAAQARLSLRDDGVAEAGDVDAFVEESPGHREGLRRVADDHGDDRMGPVRDPESRLGERAAK